MPAIRRHPTTLLDLLEHELQRTGIDPDRAHVHTDPGCEALVLPLNDGPAEIWISDHRCDLEDLAAYTGLTAHLAPQGEHGDPAAWVELYGSVSRDATADVLRLLAVILPVLTARTIGDLLLAFLDLSGISTGVQVREGCIEGIPVDLGGHAHLFVTDINGASITRPLGEHTGLLINRYYGEDLSCWRVVYDSQRTDAVADALAASAAIAAEAGRARPTTTTEGHETVTLQVESTFWP